MEQTLLNPILSNKIDSVRTISIATLIGGPLVAAYLMASNFKQLGEANKVFKTWIISIAVFIGVLTISFFLPDAIPNIVYNLVFYFIVSVFVQKYQAPQIEAHKSAAGLTYKTYRAVLIALAFDLVLIGIILLCYAFSDLSSVF
jgi:hypothetical protein